ncbi:MAG: type II secretion system protein [Myxococcota bacterium]|nr:type II secretion system protein [Myxococcota bacterium]
MQKPHGFTLIELAVAMTVMAILSTAALPGVIATARNKYGEKMVRDMMALHTAAEAHYHNQDAWPFSPNQTCSDMDRGEPSLRPLQKLQDHGYISSLLEDPFSNQPYLFSYRLIDERCHLRISTPRNAKLSPLLDDLEMTLKLLRDPVCDEVGGLKACHFDFEEPKLQKNLDERVNNNINLRVRKYHDRIAVLEDLISNPLPAKKANNDAK